MAFSTGVSLLPVGGRSFLSHSTAAITNTNYTGLVFTASPNPDNLGNTGFANTSTTGLSFTLPNDGLLSSITGTYPNYTVTFYPDPANDFVNSAYNGNITPIIKDSGGTIGEHSGLIPVSNFQRLLSWTGSTTYTTSGAADTASIIWGVGMVLDYNHYTGLVRSDNTTSSITTRGAWVNIPWGALGQHYEVKYVVTGVGGSGSVSIATFNGGVVTNGLSENVFYDVKSASNNSPVVRLQAIEGSSVTANFTVTIRNKINTSMTFSQELSMTFNN